MDLVDMNVYTKWLFWPEDIYARVGQQDVAHNKGQRGAAKVTQMLNYKKIKLFEVNILMDR